jgi:hypothetical protein
MASWRCWCYVQASLTSFGGDAAPLGAVGHVDLKFKDAIDPYWVQIIIFRITVRARMAAALKGPAALGRQPKLNLAAPF